MTQGITLVAGAGGFIDGHLVGALRRQNRAVRAVDVKPLTEWYQVHTDPINPGSNELVTINQLVDIAADIAGIRPSARTSSTLRKVLTEGAPTTRARSDEVGG